MTPWTWPDAQVLRVLDGDTITLLVTRDLGFGGEASYRVRLRLNRINAPKGSTADGIAATAYLGTLLPVGRVVGLTTEGEYKYGGPDDSPGEWMAEVKVAEGNVSDLMVSSGHAVYWSGQGPRPSDG